MLVITKLYQFNVLGIDFRTNLLSLNYNTLLAIQQPLEITSYKLLDRRYLLANELKDSSVESTRNDLGKPTSNQTRAEL